jgi:hypothetical protein
MAQGTGHPRLCCYTLSPAVCTLGGAEKPKDLATATRSSRCTLKMDFSWWLLYASRKERYASRAAYAGMQQHVSMQLNQQLQSTEEAVASSEVRDAG